MVSQNLRIVTSLSKEVIDITPKINKLISAHHIKEGLCNIFVTHTTCALTTGEVGEGTDGDLLEVAQKVVPNIKFRHAHNPSHSWSHMASSLIGTSLTIPIHQNSLTLGTWQSVLLIELDGPRERNIILNLISD